MRKKMDTSKKLKKSIPLSDLMRILTKKHSASTEAIKELRAYQIAMSKMGESMPLEEEEKIKACIEELMDIAEKFHDALQKCRIAYKAAVTVLPEQGE